jgi:hypothetical protein
MKFFLIAISIGIITCSGCKNKEPTIEAPKQTEKKNYFPVADFLKGQIRIVDSLPTAILKIVITNNKSDSAYIQRDEFNGLAREFIFPELEQQGFENNFTESSFVDQTTQSATFAYFSKNSKLELQRVDVLATPDELYSKVKSIFMQATMLKNDTIVIKKLFWQTNDHFQVTTLIQAPNKPKIMKQLRIIWD